MGIFLRLLRYSFRYRGRFLAGVSVSFIVAVLNGFTLTAFYPLFDALGDRKTEFFAIQFSKAQRNLIHKTFDKNREKIATILLTRSGAAPGNLKEWIDMENYLIPPPPGKDAGDKEKAATTINKEKARRILEILPSRLVGLTKIEDWHMRYIVLWKLRLNANGFQPIQVVYGALIFVLPMYLLRLILHLVSVRLIAKTGYMAVRDIRAALYDRVHELPLTFFYKERSGVIVSRLINDAEIVAAVISSNLRDSITNICFLVTHLFLLAYFNLQLLLVAIVAVPLILSPVTLFSRKIRKSTTRSQEYLADLNGILKEAISGVKVIRSFAMEGYEAEQFRAANQKLYWRNFKQQFYLRASPNLVELTSSLVTLGILVLGAFFMDPANFTGGEFFTFLITLLFIIRPIIQLSGMMGKIAQGSEAGRRIFELMDRPRDLQESTTPAVLRPMRKHIEFRHVGFVYPDTDRVVLEDINLEVPRGQTVALVGESGSGKSTMMDLMARFFDPTLGSIRIDGTDIRDFSIADHRSRIGIVQQETFLFHGTVRENIAYGRPDISIREIMKAARLAHAHDFIKQLPGKYDAMIGEKGLNISGGQRQRLSIARALLRDPEILILDEATSALDTQSERLVQHALDRLFRNRTVFVVAHRLSTIEKADLIVVLSGGRIVDVGTHSELMNKGGLYARLQEISREAAPGEAPAPQGIGFETSFTSG